MTTGADAAGDVGMQGPGPPTTLKPVTTPDRTHRRLTLSATDRKVAGVCGGLARYFETDPTFVRLIFVVRSRSGAAG